MEVIGVLVGLCALGAIIYGIAYGAGAGVGTIVRVADNARSRAEQVQRASEQRALELLLEFPTLDDANIAQLMRDELVNMRSGERDYYLWSTAETVARIRRTLIVAAVREQRRESMLTPPPAPTAPVEVEVVVDAPVRRTKPRRKSGFSTALVARDEPAPKWQDSRTKYRCRGCGNWAHADLSKCPSCGDPLNS